MRQIQVQKRADIATVRPDPITPYQLGRARIEATDAIKRIQFYAREIEDAGFQEFLREKLAELIPLAI